ncbi:MAG: hypothetical protein U9N34_06285, partial [Candidatus Cloacimonadota bacterium]|nr:hypothetical protein [Candidatus Cloacimonadota bacterium]
RIRGILDLAEKYDLKIVGIDSNGNYLQTDIESFRNVEKFDDKINNRLIIYDNETYNDYEYTGILESIKIIALIEEYEEVE